MTGNPDFAYLYELNRVRGTVFQIGARADPSLDNPDSFAVILFFELADGTVVEVAKVDNTEHESGTIHVDRYYRDHGAETKDFDVDIDGLYEADAYLERNWERFAQAYLDTHGKQPRDS